MGRAGHLGRTASEGEALIHQPVPQENAGLCGDLGS
jgi:hypothetical protein